MNWTVEPITNNGWQVVTHPSTDEAPPRPRQTAAESLAYHEATRARVHALSGYTGPLRRKNRDALGRGA